MRQLALSAALFTAAASARGEVLPEEQPESSEGSRSLSFELKLGPYKPLISREASLTGNPYETIFGASSMLLFELEVDKIFWQRFGTLGAGASIGYASKSAPALIAVGSGDAGTPSSESTSFKVIPIRAMLIYRLDYGALKMGIPFVPYGKAGLVYEPWWTTKGGVVEFSGTTRGAGAKYGYQFTGGLSFLLDVLEPRMAKDFSTDIGVSHSYIFAEYTYANVNNFGKAGLDLSSRHWMFGFAVDF